MDLIQIRKEIEEKAKTHKKPAMRPVRMAEFEVLSGRTFLNKAYLRLLGRLPNEREKEQYFRFYYFGELSRREILEELATSKECAEYGVDVTAILSYCHETAEGEKKLKGPFGKIVRAFRILRFLLSHRAAWRRLEKMCEIWEQEDAL